jgi:beta-lactamase class A
MRLPRLAAYLGGLDASATWSVWSGPTTGDAWLAVDADARHYAASTMKLPLAMAAYRLADAGRLDLDATIEVHNSFTSVYDGTGFGLSQPDDGDTQTWMRLGQSVALRWLALRSIVKSGNLATNLLLDAVGVTAVETLLADVGCADTVVARGIEDVRARDAGLQNLVTAADLARLLQTLWADAGADSSSSLLRPDSARELVDVLSAQQVAAAIPHRLPASTRIAHKSGWVEGVDHDAGIVFHPGAGPYVFAMCTSSGLPRADAAEIVATAARAAWDDVDERCGR